MKKILLVQPSFSYKNEITPDEEINPPLWMVNIGTYLKAAGYQVECFDRNLEEDRKQFTEKLHSFEPDFVGFSVLSGRLIYDAIEMSQEVKKDTNATVVWGGMHSSLEPTTCDRDFIDYFVRGEGEQPMLDIVEGRPDSPGVNMNPLAPLLKMSDLPFPDYSLIKAERYEGMSVATSRGCPARCTFCINRGFYGKHGQQCWRGLPAETTVRLFRTLHKTYKTRKFVIVDDNFTTNKKRLLEVCEGIKDLRLRIYLFSRVNYITEETIKALKSAGVFQIQFGFESGSQRVLDFLQKDTTLDQGRQAVKLCRKHGVLIDASFMIGLPTETLEELEETKNYIKEIDPEYIGIKVFHPLPGTELYEYCVKEGRFVPPTTLEGWADISLLNEANLNMSDIPLETLKQVQVDLEGKRMYRGYVKKFISMVKAGDLPSIAKIRRAIDHLSRRRK